LGLFFTPGAGTIKWEISCRTVTLYGRDWKKEHSWMYSPSRCCKRCPKCG